MSTHAFAAAPVPIAFATPVSSVPNAGTTTMAGMAAAATSLRVSGLHRAEGQFSEDDGKVCMESQALTAVRAREALLSSCSTSHVQCVMVSRLLCICWTFEQKTIRLEVATTHRSRACQHPGPCR